MYRLFCDSNCELWHTEVEKLGLNVIYMSYTLGDKEYFYDLGKDTDFKAFYSAMRSGAVPKTSSLPAEVYKEYFEPVLKAGEDILYVTFSRQMSKTFDALDKAVAELAGQYPERRIRSVDTGSISLGCGFVTYYAALKYAEGAEMDELEQYVKELSLHVATYFAVDNLNYLYRGGRISGVSKVFGNMLGIKPVLHFDREGRIVVATKAKGFKKALSLMLGYMKELGEDVEKYKIFILEADCRQAAEEFAEAIRAEYPAADITLQPVGPVIGAHCGPGTIGLIFHAAKR